MNFNLEKNFPTFTNNKEKIKSGQSRLDFLKSLGKKAVPYIAAMTALLASPTFSKAQDKVKDNSNTVWTIKSPDGKQTKTFNTKEERDAFAKAHNLNISSEKPTERKDTVVKNDSQGSKVEWKLTSPDGKQTKTFNTKEERDEFARQHHIILPGANTATTNPQNKTNTVNYQDFIKNAPPGKSKVIQIDSNNDAKIYKVKKEGKKVKVKEEGGVQVIRTQN